MPSDRFCYQEVSPSDTRVNGPLLEQPLKVKAAVPILSVSTAPVVVILRVLVEVESPAPLPTSPELVFRVTVVASTWSPVALALVIVPLPLAEMATLPVWAVAITLPPKVIPELLPVALSVTEVSADTSPVVVSAPAAVNLKVLPALDAPS